MVIANTKEKKVMMVKNKAYEVIDFDANNGRYRALCAVLFSSLHVERMNHERTALTKGLLNESRWSVE